VGIYSVNDVRISQAPSRLDLLLQYEPVLEFILIHKELESILNVGSSFGLSSVYTGSFSTVVELSSLTSKEQFDLVCAIDVLQYISPSDRNHFWNTLKQVTKRWALISIPISHEMDIEILAMHMQGTNITLSETFLNVLSHPSPKTNLINEEIAEIGFRVIKEVSYEPRLAHYLTMLNNTVEGKWKIRVLNDIHRLNRAVSQHPEWPSYRTLWVLEVPLECYQ
jgi:hypothetical protein